MKSVCSCINKSIPWLFYGFFAIYLICSIASYWLNVNVLFVLITGILALLFASIDLCFSAFNISSEYGNKFEKVLAKTMSVIFIMLSLFILVYLSYKFYGLTQYLEKNAFSSEINILTFATMAIFFLQKAMEKRVKSNRI